MKKIVFALLMGAVCAPSFAHQLKSAISTVLFNANSQHLEIMHRFYLHDAEHAVAALGFKNADIVSDTTTQKAFADYVTEHFKMVIDEKQVTLNSVGYEVDGRFLWVYQDTKLPGKVGSIQIKHSALQDIWPDQINTVNVEGQINGDKALKTLTFRESGKVLEVTFP